MLEKCVSHHAHQRMAVKTLPRSSLIVIETKLFLQLLLGVLTDPSGLDRGSQAAQSELRSSGQLLVRTSQMDFAVSVAPGDSTGRRAAAYCQIGSPNCVGKRSRSHCRPRHCCSQQRHGP
jgi:hypothetical protein